MQKPCFKREEALFPINNQKCSQCQCVLTSPHCRRASLLWEGGKWPTWVALTAAVTLCVIAADNTLLSVQWCSPCQEPTPCCHHLWPSSHNLSLDGTPKLSRNKVLTQPKLPKLIVFQQPSQLLLELSYMEAKGENLFFIIPAIF